ncbi:hypothetical protein HC931_07735 [Candidatus Gracilibacteria bacterium]|nr:hypothetical protein [Candidatus Gracilibacteria bacterium]NJM90501.1 hypothetical protein [Hydrococcus sp. RU_2_2]NJP22308.1 hypothetical protein [Hydrococcus sp. CRU_1_1]
MMTGNSETTNESPSKLQRLVMIFVLTSDEYNDDLDDLTPIDELPRWTVRELEDGFEIEEGIELVESALARRFSDRSRTSVIEEVAIDFQTMNRSDF